MAVQLFANNATTTLNGGISDSALSIVLTDASAFPIPTAGQYFLITIEVGGAHEIVMITGRSGNTLTVDPSGRGMENTSAVSWANGSLVEMRVTRDTLRRFARYEDLLNGYASSIFDPSTDLLTANAVALAGPDGKLTDDGADITYNAATNTFTVPKLIATTSTATPILDSGGAVDLLIKTNNGTTQFTVGHIASAVNTIRAKGGTTGNGAIIEVIGETNADLSVSSAGTGLVKVTGPYGYTGIISPSQITSNQNNYNPTSAGTSSIIRITSDAARTITGFAGGTSGRVVTFLNVGSFGITFTNEDSNSTAGNRFALSSPNTQVPAGGSLTLWYDTTSSRWRGFASPSSGSSDVIQALTDQTPPTTISWDMSLGAWATLTLTGTNRRMGTPSNIIDGKEYTLFVIQDGVGNRTFDPDSGEGWTSVWKFPLGAPPVLSTAANAVDMFSFKARGGNLYGGMLPDLKQT